MNRLNTKDPPIVITDNVECLKILLDEGIVEQLKPKDGANVVYHSYQSKDHYCMASYHTDHGNNDDDGYLIVMVPKSSWSFMDAAHFFSNAISENIEDGGSISYGYKKVPPKQNN